MNNSGVRFREAAAAGNIREMCAIYDRGGFDIEQKGPSSGKTAAHQAAARGRASVLRLLHNWGDSFTAIDNAGKTPEEYAANSVCIKVFAMVKEGKKAVEVARLLFPVKSPPTDGSIDFLNAIKVVLAEDESLKRFRKEILSKTMEERKQIEETLLAIAFKEDRIFNDIYMEKTMSSLAEWVRDNMVIMFNRIHGYHIIDQAGIKNQSYALCSEQSAVANAYLTTMANTIVPVELVASVKEDEDGVKWNHAFVILNRAQDKSLSDFTGYSEAFAVDPLEERTLFYEHIDIAPDKSMVKKAKKYPTIPLCSSMKLPFFVSVPFATETEHEFYDFEKRVVEKTKRRLVEVIEQKQAALLPNAIAAFNEKS